MSRNGARAARPRSSRARTSRSIAPHATVTYGPTIDRPTAWLMDLGGGRRTAAGEVVTEERALALSTYWACLNDISQDLAKLPLELRRQRATKGSDEAREHPVWKLLRRRPNPVMGPMVFRMVMQHRVMAWGNAYAEIVRNSLGEPMQLWPIHPARIKPELQRDGQTLLYRYRPDGKFVLETLEARDVLHIRGLGSGVEGYSVLRLASDALGLGLAAQTHAAAFYGEGMGKRMVAVAKNVLGPKGREEFRRRIKGDNENDPVGSRKLPFLEGDISLQELGIPPDQAQFLETRTFAVPDVARWFRMALAKLQHSERAQGWSTLEALNRDYATDALQPWATLTEEECWAKLLNESEQAADRLYFKHEFKALVRADLTARFTVYVQGIQNGIYSQNDVRDLEDMNPIEDPAADEYRQQKQMAKLGSGDEQPDQPPPPPPPGAPPPKPQEDDEEADAKAAAAFRPVFLATAQRLVKKEVNAARRLLQQHAGNAAAHQAALAELGRQHAAEIAQAFEAPLATVRALCPGLAASAYDFDAILRDLGPLGTSVDEASRAAQLADAFLVREPVHA